jgi:hypothetical protein
MTNDNPTTSDRQAYLPDGADKVTGRAAYAADATMPGMIWGGCAQPHPMPASSRSTPEGRGFPASWPWSRPDTSISRSTRAGDGIQDMRWMSRNVMAREGAVPRPSGRRRRRDLPGGRGEALKLIEVDCEVLLAISVGDAMGPDAAPFHDHVSSKASLQHRAPLNTRR